MALVRRRPDPARLRGARRRRANPCGGGGRAGGRGELVENLGGPEVLSFADVVGRSSRRSSAGRLKSIHAPATVYRVLADLLEPLSPPAGNLMAMSWRSASGHRVRRPAAAGRFGVRLTSAEEFLRAKAALRPKPEALPWASSLGRDRPVSGADRRRRLDHHRPGPRLRSRRAGGPGRRHVPGGRGVHGLVGSLLHGRRGAVARRTGALFALSGVPTAYWARKLTRMVSPPVLLLIFAGLMLTVSAVLLIRRTPTPMRAAIVRAFPGPSFRGWGSVS